MLDRGRHRQNQPARTLHRHFVGLWSSAGADDTRQRFIADLGKSLRDMASRTNRVSRVYLEAAAEG
jgi:hypothetical protein